MPRSIGFANTSLPSMARATGRAMSQRSWVSLAGHHPHQDAPDLCRRTPLQADQALDVVDETGETDLYGRLSDADGPDEQPHPALLFGKDVLDVGADLGL